MRNLTRILDLKTSTELEFSILLQYFEVGNEFFASQDIGQDKI